MSSKVEFEAKRASGRSTFSFAVWTKTSFPVHNDGSKGWVKLPVYERPEFMSSGRVALKLLANFGDMFGPCFGNLPLKEPRGSAVFLF